MKFGFAASLFALTMVFSSAQAETWHMVNTEIGYETHAGESMPGKSGDQVRQELLAAKADQREWFFKNLNIAKPSWTQKSEKTREKVIQEMQSMPADELAWINEVYTPGS
ncbi:MULTISPECIES: hypothetical protein [Achromobacter]|nr:MULTISPECIES: hypothetical protein [Achromobacter]ASC66194.1 DUF4148 domain-containing protein [Achromobacter denitrificans]